MKLGWALNVAGAWATPENQVRVAQRAEALGYSGLWVLQRLLYALDPKGSYPPMPNQPWPKIFESVADPIVTLAFVAGQTSRIRLGTSVLIMPYYSPILLAKQLATLDQVSGGRLDVGLGLGWSEDEFDASGVPFKQRGRRGDEFLRCLKAIWTQDEVEFHGDFYHVPRSRVLPRPRQKPHPPITVGGYSDVVVQRAVTLGDGFNGGNMPLAEVRPLVARIRQAADKAGRDPAGLHVVCRGAFRLHDAPQGPGRRALWGSLDEIREDVQRYAEAGLTELFLEGNFTLADAPIGRALEVMEQLARADRRYFSRGSSASRRPSPKRLKPSTVTKIARPGNSDSQALAWMKETLALRSQPQLGVGGWVPRPRKDSVASTMIEVAMPSVVVTMIGARQFGST